MSLTKEVHRLLRNVSKLTDGQVIVESFDSENNKCQVVKVVVEPNDGLYKGGRFRFSISIPESYPTCDKIPTVWCDTKVYHPNIDTKNPPLENFSSNVCLNILEDDIWDNSFGLGGVVLGLLFLMHNPNFEEPLSVAFDNGTVEDHIKNVGKYMNGEDVDGETYELEREGTSAGNNVDTINKDSEMTETTAGETTKKDEVVSESKEERVNTVTPVGCAVDATPKTADEKLLTSEDKDTIDRASEYRVLSIDGELVFICESSTDNVKDTESDGNDLATLTVTESNNENELSNEHTHILKGAENENENVRSESTDENKRISNNTIENEIDGATDNTLREKGNDSGKIFGVLTDDFNQNHPSSREGSVCMTVLVHRQYRVVRRSARRLFANSPYTRYT